MSKFITFPVGYRPEYLKVFLDSLHTKDLTGYTVVCSAEKSPECIEILKQHPLPKSILYRENSEGRPTFNGARENMYKPLKYAFDEGSDFVVVLMDDMELSPDVMNLVNWYYASYKSKPLTYMSYGLFHRASKSVDKFGIEVVPGNGFDGFGFCIFRENWEVCFKKWLLDDTLSWKNFNQSGWDWAITGAFREFNYHSVRPKWSRLNHTGRVKGTCCSVDHYDQVFLKLDWNRTEIYTEFKIVE